MQDDIFWLLLGRRNGYIAGQGRVEIVGGITCTDDGEGNITMTEEDENNG